jgi:hypothetical protein
MKLAPATTLFWAEIARRSAIQAQVRDEINWYGSDHSELYMIHVRHPWTKTLKPKTDRGGWGEMTVLNVPFEWEWLYALPHSLHGGN